jgi:hypothetical protein
MRAAHRPRFEITNQLRCDIKSNGPAGAWVAMRLQRRWPCVATSCPVAAFHSRAVLSSEAVTMLHRADMAWALHAASQGLPEQQIREEILHARDLSKKGGPARQLDYAQRTALKAFSIVEPLR